MLTLAALEEAATTVYRHMAPTPLYGWPLLDQHAGCQVLVKHENHAPTGSFKARGSLVYMEAMARQHPSGTSFITATRGNHGLSMAWAAKIYGFHVASVVPQGNSPEQNAAVQAMGAFLIEHGSSFEEAQERAFTISEEARYNSIPSFHMDLVKGSATYAMELFRKAPRLDAVFVPMGLGNGICGVLAAKAIFRAETRVIGVVSENAPAYVRAVESGDMQGAPSKPTFADGLAVADPDPEAAAIIRAGVDHMVQVSDDEIAEAIRILYRATHNLSEGAGAASLAGLMQERAKWAGKRVAIILCGQNIDRHWMHDILAGRTPSA
ncbi:threonine dehydratase [Pseudovibrio sp. SPO723]|uniref:threonine dehydratase n=1 Tax=Nesiotobacter zosterae TaxID=392721 RepID=UPI0029C5E6CE|nr:threonine dehydratase [Pseudovibrio sp. SPO723]MDX5592471.1 threonine dehydratase [Pseudovibrio sp. SPO723]